VVEVRASLLAALICGIVGCGSPSPNDAGADAHTVLQDGGTVMHACPFDLDRSSCEAREATSHCAWAEQCGAPTIPRAGCLQVRACVVDEDCEPGLLCRRVNVTGSGLDGCANVALCVPAEGA
jgi:hypothetical protein